MNSVSNFVEVWTKMSGAMQAFHSDRCVSQEPWKQFQAIQTIESNSTKTARLRLKETLINTPAHLREIIIIAASTGICKGSSATDLIKYWSVIYKDTQGYFFERP